MGIVLLCLGRSESFRVGMVASACGRVGRLLDALERVGRFDRRLDVLFAHAGAHLGEPRVFLLRLALGLIPVGLEDHDGAMPAVDEMPAHEVLEIGLAGGDLRLDRGERRREGQRRERIAPVQPGAQRAQHEHDAAREGAGVVLAQMEFDGVERRLEGGGVDALGGERRHGVEDQALDLVGVGGVDALEADREHRLAQAVVEAVAGERLAEPGIDQRLVQRRRGGADQDVLQDVEAERGLDVGRLVEHPVDREHGLARAPRRRRGRSSLLAA